MAFEKLSADVARGMHDVPKDKRLDYLKSKIAELPADERASAEHVMGLTLISVDHTPPDRRSVKERFVSFFCWTDFLSIALIISGVAVVLVGQGTGEVEFSLTDLSVKTNSAGYFLILIGVCVFLARGRLNGARS